MTDVLGYLADKGIPLKRAGAVNVHTTCFFCGEDPGARGRLYINVDPDAEPPGLYKCFLCEAKGNLVTLKRHFGDSLAAADLDSQTRTDIYEDAADYYHRRLSDYLDVWRYLKGVDRGLTAATIRAHRLGYAPMHSSYDLATNETTVARPADLYGHLREQYDTKDILASGLCQSGSNGKIVDALAGMIVIPYIVAGHVVALRGRTWPYTEADWSEWHGERYEPSPAKYKTPAGTKARLFNSDVCWNHDEVVVAEGEMDALILEQHGVAAVAVPGATTWQDSWDDYLTHSKRVFVLFDRDTAGEKAAGKLIERLGPKARAVHLSEPGTKCDPTQWFARDGHTAEEFTELLAEARRGGLLVTVREAIDEFRNVQSQPGIKFGWEKLDIMIAPGMHPSQLMVILAKTNAGKSILLMNLMQRVRMVPGQEHMKLLFVSLEQTRGEWWDRARRMHRFFNLDADEEDAARFWDDNLLIVDKNRVSEVEFRQILDDYDYQFGQLPDLTFIDYLGYFARGFRGEAYQRTSDAMMALKAVAKDAHVPMILPHQVSRVGVDGQEFGADAARDSGVVEETADFLLTMWSPDNQLLRDEDDKSGQIHLRIAKSRHGGRGVLLGMQFAPISLVMVPDDDPLCARARREHSWKQEHQDTWEQAVYRHRTGFEGHLADGPLAETRSLGGTQWQ